MPGLGPSSEAYHLQWCCAHLAHTDVYVHIYYVYLHVYVILYTHNICRLATV